MKFILCLLFFPLLNAQVLVDDYTTGIIGNPGVNSVAGSPNNPLYDFGSQRGDMLTTERDCRAGAEKKNGGGNDGSAKILLSQTCACSSDTNVYPHWTIQWDGVDDSINVKTDTKISDFSIVCPSHAPPFFLVNIDDTDKCADVPISIYTPGKYTVAKSYPSFDNMGTCIPYPGLVSYPLSEYVSQGATLSDIRAISIDFNGKIQDVDAIDWTMRQFGVCCCTIDIDCDDGIPETVDICKADCGCDNIAPTEAPTIAPTFVPTLLPTTPPTLSPTIQPTISPTAKPTSPPESSIGDYVWHDLNENGLQDDGPPGVVGLPGVTVTLWYDNDNDCVVSVGDTVADTQVTNSTGYYLFDPIPNGDYIVEVTDSNTLTNYFATTPTFICTPNLVSQHPRDRDFGFIAYASLGDLVWYDEDYDGVQELGLPSEYGIEDVTVYLYQDMDNNCMIDAGDPPIGTAVTDVDGYYLFPFLMPNRRYIALQTDDNSVLVGFQRTTFHNPFCEYLSFGESFLDADWGFVDFDCPAGVCVEAAKENVCYYDEDNHVVHLCAVMAEIPTLFGNGAFPPGTNQHDCYCQPLTGEPTPATTFEPSAVPTSEPTAEPTVTPTPPPSAIPTPPPTFAPTVPPTTEPTSDPTAAPTATPTLESCSDVSSTSGEVMRCVMDATYIVTLQSVPFPLNPQAGETYIEQGTNFNVFGQDIYFHCDCSTDCPSGMINIFFPPPISQFANNQLKLVVGVPSDFLFSEMHFQNPDGDDLTDGGCVNTTDLPTCLAWSTGPDFVGNCWTQYEVDVQFSLLTPELVPHEDGALLTYYGVLYVESHKLVGVDNRQHDIFYIERQNFRFSVSFPIDIEAHVDDIRVYDEVNKLENLDAVRIYGVDFTLGAAWSTTIWGDLSFSTSTQWPFKLDLNAFSLTNRAADLVLSSVGVNDALCSDPLIGDYKDTQWMASAAENLFGDVPLPCDQAWVFRIDTVAPTCTFDDLYNFAFDISCQPTYSGNCPLDTRYSGTLNVDLDIETGDFCDMFTDTITSSAVLSSYDCPARTCACTKEDFVINFFEGIYKPESVYFQVDINSTSDLLASELRSLDVTVNCQSGSGSMEEIYNYLDGWDFDVMGNVASCPTTQCGVSGPAEIVQFDFDLANSVWLIDPDDSCELRVWATVDLFYNGVDRPDGRQPSVLCTKKLLEVLDEADISALGNTAPFDRFSVVTGGIRVSRPKSEPGDDLYRPTSSSTVYTPLLLCLALFPILGYLQL